MAVMSREGTKATTLDYPSGYTRQVLCADAISGPDGGGTAAPTEAQLTILHDNGMVKDLPPAATWVHASLLINDVFRNPAGAQAREWLVESGAAYERAHQAVDLARREQRHVANLQRSWRDSRKRRERAQPSSRISTVTPRIASGCFCSQLRANGHIGTTVSPVAAARSSAASTR